MKAVRVGDSDFVDFWQQLFFKCEFQHPFYQPWNTKYYDALWPESRFVDHSFIIEEKKIPIMGVRVTYDEPPNGPQRLTYFGMPIMYVENHNIPPNQIRGAQKALKVEWESIFRAYQIDLVHYQDFAEGGQLSFLGRYLLNKGGLAVPHLTQIIDLSGTEAELYSGIRKSYKSLVNWGKKNLFLRVLDDESITPEDIESFRHLHFEASGRATRSRESWRVQYEMISNKEAFAVLGDLDDELVTAALFPYSSKYCYYGVSASKRDLFSKPLSHVVMWKAIKNAKDLGCRFFELGPQYYPKQHPGATKKDFSISTFKHGFGGSTHVRLNIVWES
jgi:hypothetical protein